MSVFTASAFKACGFEAVTVDATAGGVGVTTTNLVNKPTANGEYDPARHVVEAFMTLETATIRYTLDGTAPTAAVGHILNSGDSILVQGYDNIRRFRGFRTTGTSGDLKVTFFRKA